jgi:hypothetical protein
MMDDKGSDKDRSRTEKVTIGRDGYHVLFIVRVLEGEVLEGELREPSPNEFFDAVQGHLTGHAVAKPRDGEATKLVIVEDFNGAHFGAESRLDLVGSHVLPNMCEENEQFKTQVYFCTYNRNLLKKSGAFDKILLIGILR